MTSEELLNLFDDTTKHCREVLIAKNHDYTSGSHDPFANFKASELLGVPLQKSILIRMLDKMKRIQTFSEKDQLKVSSESVTDACDDIINYSFLIKASFIEARLKRDQSELPIQ
jgi:hypothetical protein